MVLTRTLLPEVWFYRLVTLELLESLSKMQSPWPFLKAIKSESPFYSEDLYVRKV